MADAERAPRRARTPLLLGVLLAVAGCASATTPPSSTPLAAPTEVPIQIVNNVPRVAARINGSPQVAFLIVDTGAAATILSPRLADRLGIVVPAQAPRRNIQIVGGQMVPVVRTVVSMIQIGAAVVENLEVGVYDAVPTEPTVDGILGGDVLHRFTVTLDHASRRMLLAPRAPR
ncbi:MAG TPA: retropepsin-like aspartic protease [Methylomirabilota bacterium]